MRLAGGSPFNSGSVEIYRQGAWGPVCREGWNQTDSSVACRELGFAKAVTGKNGGKERSVRFCCSVQCNF